MKKLRVAVIGVGNMGQHHARVYSETEGVELIAVSDMNVQRAIEISNKYQCNYYQDYELMLKKEKIDAASIAVPSSLHKEVAVKLINNGIHVLIEKPIALTTEDAREIIEYAEKNKVKLLVGHIERFNPVVAKLKELLKTGMFGQPIIISATRVGAFPKQINDTNVVLDLGVHDIDVINYLFEDYPKHIFSEAVTGKDGREHAAQMLLNYDYNKVGIIQTNWLTPIKKRNIAINCTEGYLEADYITQEITCYSTLSEQLPEDYIQFLEYKSGQKIIKIKHEEPLKIEIRHFIDSINNGTETLVNGDEGLKVLKIALGAVESIRKNERIDLEKHD